jgi:hypothetical protein
LPFALAAYRLREGKAAAHFVIFLPTERKHVIRLGPPGVAAEIVDEAAVAGELGRGNA